MIPLKKCNFITGDTRSVSYGLHKILYFLDLEGRNVIVFYPQPKNSRLNLTYFFNNRKVYENFDDLKSQLTNPEVMFRSDLLVLDIWHLRKLEIEYLNLVKSLNMEFIVVSRNYHYTSSEDVCDYHISTETSLHLHTDKFSITDKINGWKSDIDSLQKSYIRDLKIDKLFGNEENS